MIVSREQEAKFIIKRKCYQIRELPGGDYGLVYSSAIHWKEGMEVFESAEDCRAEIDRRLKIRMDAGACPRCELPALDRTQRDITGLEHFAGHPDLYSCASCGTIWYLGRKEGQAYAYDGSLSDRLIDWAKRNPVPSAETEEMLAAIGDISSDPAYGLYPARATLNTGFELRNVLIKLREGPPPAVFFKRSDWYYLDELEQIAPSESAYPFAIAKYIMEDPPAFIYVREKSGKEIYAFDSDAGVFMPEEFYGKIMELVDPGSIEYKNDLVNMIYQQADRCGPDYWGLTPPKGPIWIWGNRESS